MNPHVQRWQKRPVIINAVQFNGVMDGALELWLGDAFISWLPSYVAGDDRAALVFEVKKGGGEATVYPGDWIIVEQDGDGFYPCTENDFAATYVEPGGNPL